MKKKKTKLYILIYIYLYIYELSIMVGFLACFHSIVLQM